MFKEFVALSLLSLVWGNSVYNARATDSIDWWQHANFYQIYPRSWKDSNGDGVGDLIGITSKLEHLTDLGINAIWMSPMFQSPQKDFGYDISDFFAIHDEYGTMKDFEDFMAKSTELGINILLDFVPNHSSDQCEWFVKSVNREGVYTDYYTWHNGKLDAQGNRIAPNNWVRYAHICFPYKTNMYIRICRYQFSVDQHGHLMKYVNNIICISSIQNSQILTIEIHW